MLKLYVKVFYVVGKALSGKLSCPCDRSVSVPVQNYRYCFCCPDVGMGLGISVTIESFRTVFL